LAGLRRLLARFTSINPDVAKFLLNLLVVHLETHDSAELTLKGIDFDYAYNALDQPVGTFAVGTSESLGERIALNPYPQTNTLSFDFSIFVVPEPSTWVMLLLGFAGLGYLGYRQTRRAKPQAA
jgi:hypothetical protein